MPATAQQNIRKALATYRAVSFSTKTGVRAYFAEKEAARAAVRAAVDEARRGALSHRVAA